jgi:hypothetical protein
MTVMITVLIIIVVCITAGKRTYGMEGDEVFSYISATSMGGFKQICFLDDQTWYDASYFENALTATGEERFNVKMVVENQAMDTHPPLYYIFLNFICSVFEGKFSRWFGIGLNIFFLLLTGIGLYLLMQHFLNNKYMSLFLTAVFCCSYFTLGMVLFIRMYMLLMALVVFQSWYHIRFYENVMKKPEGYLVKMHIVQYLILIVLTVLGGLTHYYFLVYQALIAAVYVLELWLNKRYKDIFRYIGAMIVSAIVYICLYPAMLNHIFFKYRGRDAVHKFLKEGTLFGDVISMFESFNKRLFGNWLIVIIVVLTGITTCLIIAKRISVKNVAKDFLLILPCLVYFFGISKASPFSSVRYVSPIAPLLFAGIAIWAKKLVEVFPVKKLYSKLGCIIISACLCFTSVYTFDEPLKDAYFLERKEIVDELSKEVEYCVYISGDAYNWKMWEDYINYPEFEKLFFIDGRYMKTITDERMKQADSFVLYIDKALDLNAMISYLKTYLAPKQYEVVYETSYTYIILAN